MLAALLHRHDIHRINSSACEVNRIVDESGWMSQDLRIERQDMLDHNEWNVTATAKPH